MGYTFSRQRLYASLLALGACILLYRTTTMLVQGSLSILALWAGTLLVAEMLIDLGCLISSIRWWILKNLGGMRLPLRFGAAAAILHVIRVLIFVLGRTGPWVDFDVRPEQKAMHDAHWTWTGVWFAAIMAVLGIAGVIVIWTIIRRSGKRRGG